MHIYLVVVAARMQVATSVGCSHFAAMSVCSNMLQVLMVVAACMLVAICCFFAQSPKDLGRIQLPALTKGNEVVTLSVFTQANWHFCHSSPDTCEYVCTTATNLIVLRTVAMKNSVAIPRQELPFTHHRNKSPLWNVPTGVAISMA
jgi:hypothetical protein